MEMELGKTRFNRLETLLDTCSSHEENIDIIVPDASPDILRILGAFGNVSLRDESVRDGRYEISGMVAGWVLYVSEGDMTVRHLEVNIPFMHTFDHSEIESDDIGIARISLSGLEAREINPRKVTVRANITLCAKVYESDTAEFICSLPNAEEYGIECNTETVSAFAPIAVQKKNFTLSDDIEIPGTKPEYGSMLRCHAVLRLADTKIIGSKAVIKGIAHLKCIYLSKGGEPTTLEQDLPYSQIMEAEGMNENCELDVQMQSGDLKLEPQYDMSGDVHYLMLNLPIRMSAVVSARNEAEMITDLYSTRYPLDTDFREQTMVDRSDRLNKQVIVNESLSCENKVGRIVDVSVGVEPTRKRMEEGEEALANSLILNVLYLDEEGSLSCVNKRCESVCPLPNYEKEYQAAVSVSSVTHSIEPNGEISVRLNVDYDIIEFDTRNMRMLGQVHVDTESPIDMSGAPSVIVRSVNHGDTLWKLAKQYRTTVDEILAANNLSSTEIIAGEMILIPKNRS